MPRRGKKTKKPIETTRDIRFSINDDMEIGASTYPSISMPLIRNAAPTLLASQIESVTPIRYEDLSKKEQSEWDAREQKQKERQASTIKLDYKLAPYASHTRSGAIYHANGNDTYIHWEWLRNRILRDEIDKFIVPKGKWNYEHHSIPEGTEKFNQFLSNYQEGDEIWLYENNGFHCLAGRAGWVMLRNNKIIAVHQTCIS